MNRKHHIRLRRNSPATVAAIWLAAVSAMVVSPATSARANDQPNLIYIMADEF